MGKNISGSEDNNNNQSTDQGSAHRSFLRKSVVGAAGEGYQLPLGTVKARMRLGLHHLKYILAEMGVDEI